MDSLLSGNWCHLNEENGDEYFGECRPGTDIKEGRGVWLHLSNLHESYFKDGLLHGRVQRINTDESYNIGSMKEGVFQWYMTYNKYGVSISKT